MTHTVFWFGVSAQVMYIRHCLLLFNATVMTLLPSSLIKTLMACSTATKLQSFFTIIHPLLPG